MHPLVFIIVLNWNSWRDTLECLRSLAQLDYPNYRVLVVDNGSTDGSEERIREAYPALDLLQTGANLGYAGGNNVGIRHALSHGAAYVLVVNPDVLVEQRTLTTLMEVTLCHPRIGALSPVVRFKDKHGTVWFGGSVIHWQEGRVGHTTIQEDGELCQPCAWASGCCLLMSAKALLEVGLFDHRYFMYYEEADLCQRMSRAGYMVAVCPRANVFHQLSTGETTKHETPGFIYYMTRNSLRFFFRYVNRHGVSRVQLLWTLYRRYLLNRTTARALRRRQPAALARLQACVDFAIGRYGASERYSRPGNPFV
jgi:GT2 family glycosyltransferase